MGGQAPAGTTPPDRALDRRQFLIRTGVLGAAAGAGLTGPRALAGSDPAKALTDALAPALQGLARDTIAGLVAFVVPGPDAYSRAQGVTTPEPGGVAAKGPEFLMGALDSFFPLPDEAVHPLATALATGVSDSLGPMPLIDGLLNVPIELTRQVDQALSTLLHNDATVPLSLLIAMLLNGTATLADPSSLVGPFPTSPFANLAYDDKIEVFRLMEEDTHRVVALVDDGLPQPLHQSLSGLVAFVAGALLEFAAFGSFTEFGALDRRDRRLTGVPVGWQHTGYLAETEFTPVEGWDELRGYYQDRTEVEP